MTHQYVLTKIQRGGVSNGKFQKALDYDTIEKNALKLNDQQKQKLIKKLQNGSFKVEMKLVAPPMAMAAKVLTLRPLTEMITKMPSGATKIDSQSEAEKILKMSEFIDGLDDSQKKAVREFIALKKSLEEAPAKESEVKETPKE